MVPILFQGRATRMMQESPVNLQFVSGKLLVKTHRNHRPRSRSGHSNIPSLNQSQQIMIWELYLRAMVIYRVATGQKQIKRRRFSK